MTEKQKEKILNARWEKMKAAMHADLPVLLIEKVDGIMNDLRNMEIALNRPQSRRCRKSASR